MDSEVTTTLFAIWNVAVSAGAILSLGYARMGAIASIILGILAVSALVTWSTIAYYTYTKA